MLRNGGQYHRNSHKVTVLVMLHQGHSIEVVEAALGLDDNTIRRYWAGYEEKGIETYLSDHYHPYGGNLTGEQEKQLATDHDEYFYEDVKPIIKWVSKHFGISYTPSGMRDLCIAWVSYISKPKAFPVRQTKKDSLSF